MIKQRKVFVLIVSAISILIAVTIYLYTVQVNHAVNNNMLVNMQEISMHDLQSIQTFLDEDWSELENIIIRLRAAHMDSQREVLNLLDIEASSHEYSHIFLLDDRGNLYADHQKVYRSAEHDLTHYMEEDAQRYVVRYDNNGFFPDVKNSTLLYRIKVDNLKIGSTNFVGLYGLIDLNSIQRGLKIDSFGGKGFSSILDQDGYYFINLQSDGKGREGANFFQKIQESNVQDNMDARTLKSRSSHSKSLFFWIVDKSGEKNIVAFHSIKGTPWYFLTEVPSQVFRDRSWEYINMSIYMLTAVIILTILIIVLLIVSQRKVMLAHAEAEAKSQFLSNMSHEIRTPLNGLVGLNHLMKSNIDNQGKVEDYLDKASSIIQYLLSLVNDILDMNKLQAGRIILQQEAFDLNEVILSIQSMQQENIDSKGVKLIVDSQPAFPAVIGDKVRIKQVLMNIVGNAAKFTPEGGTITLRVLQRRREDEQLVTIFQVCDTGIGMSQEFQKHIFESFSQERSRNTKSIKGTGLGMSISHLLVEAMDGEIQVESELDQGTLFTVTLPLELAQEDALVPGEVAAAETDRKKPLRILVAEDNELNADILLEILEEQGFTTAYAKNGKEALEIFSASAVNEFDAILMDVQMPIMDGLQAARRIRGLSRPDARKIVILACTANTFQDDRDRALESGMDGFLAKPIDMEVLLKTLGEYCGT